MIYVTAIFFWFIPLFISSVIHAFHRVKVQLRDHIRLNEYDVIEYIYYKTKYFFCRNGSFNKMGEESIGFKEFESTATCTSIQYIVHIKWKHDSSLTSFKQCKIYSYAVFLDYDIKV